jgi:phosphatidate cytidylyltransferase
MISTTIALALAGIWGFLGFASIVVYVMTKKYPHKSYQELILRTKSWWVIVGIFTVMTLIGPTASLCFLGFLSFLALKEFFSIIPMRQVDRRVLFWAYLAIPAQYYWAATSWYGMFVIFIPIYMFLFIALRTVLTQSIEGFLKAVGTIHWVLMTTVFSLSHLAYLLVLPALPSHQTGGTGLLLYVIFLTQFNDIAQYVCGKYCGKHLILPVVSPRKTWEGFIGGVAITVILAMVLAPFLTPFDLIHALFAGCIIGIFGFMGDVTISAIKRDIGVKDTGAIIPGHGGIMDRIDSLTFTAPLFFHFTYYFYY